MTFVAALTTYQQPLSLKLLPESMALTPQLPYLSLHHLAQEWGIMPL
jgi:hypothetical protein